MPNSYNQRKGGEKEEVAEKGQEAKKKASFKETSNPSETVPVLPQQKGAE